jgi:ATP-binding cassette, subfamily B, bacterial MsbA
MEYIRRLLPYIKPYRAKIAIAIIAMVGAALTIGAYAIIVKDVVDDVLLTQAPGAVTLLIVIIIAIAVIGSVCLYIESYISSMVGQSVVMELRNDVFSNVIGLTPLYFSKHPTPTVLSKMINDIEVVQEVLRISVTTMVKEVITVFVLFGVMLYRSPFLTLACVFVFPVITFLLYFFGRRLQRLSEYRLEQLGNLTNRLSQTLDNLRVVQAFGREGFERKRFRSETDALFERLMHVVRTTSLSVPLLDIIKGVSLAVIISVSAYAVSSGTMSLGVVLSFGAALGLIYMPIKRIVQLYNQASLGAGALKRIFDLVDARPAIEDVDTPRELKGVGGGMRFDDVSLSYGRKKALSNVSFDVAAGEVVALVGPSGAGKSSLINLLLRFYDPTSGSLLIDGEDIRNVSIESLRSHVSWVSQENLLFNDTVRENITYGYPTATDAEIHKAADAAHASEFISNLPDGYETNIGEHGLSLSGGERQRIAMARAFLRKSPILVLDEATSSVDAPTEGLIQDAIRELVKGRTTLVIAHRASTVTLADRIAVLDRGELVAMGGHEELLAESDLYARLYRSQFSTEG